MCGLNVVKGMVVYMKKTKIFLILILICVFLVTGCDKKNNNETNSLDSKTTSEKVTTSTEEITTSSKTTTTKSTTTTKKSTKKTTTAKKSTKKAGPTLIDGKPECDRNNAEFVAYVENYKKNYASMSPDYAKEAPYVVFFYTEAEKNDYVEYAYRLKYINEGGSIPYENSTCKGKLYMQMLRITFYHQKPLNKAIYLPATPKDKLIPAETYLEQNGLV